MQDAVLKKIVYEEGLDYYTYQRLISINYGEDYFLRQAGIQRGISPAEAVQEKFHEIHIKREIEKAAKNSK